MTPRLTAALVLSALGCIAPAAAAQPPEDNMIHAMLVDADTDGDGFVTKAEATALVEKTRRDKATESASAWGDLVTFAGAPAGAVDIPGDAYADALSRTLRSADADGDGTVSAKEMKAYVDGLPPGPARRIVSEVTGALDADGDGTLSAAEIRTGLDAIRAGGTMSLKVVTEAAQKQADMERLLLDLMAKETGDADGRITVARFAGALEPAVKPKD